MSPLKLFGYRVGKASGLCRKGRAQPIWMAVMAAATAGGVAVVPMLQEDTQQAVQPSPGQPPAGGAAMSSPDFTASQPSPGAAPPQYWSTDASTAAAPPQSYPQAAMPPTVGTGWSSPAFPTNTPGSDWTAPPSAAFRSQFRADAASPSGGAAPRSASEPPSVLAPQSAPAGSPAAALATRPLVGGSLTPPAPRQVDLYYATDRKLISAEGIDFWISIAGPAGIAAIGTLVAFAAFFISRVKWIWGVAALGGLAATAITGVGAAQRASQANAMVDMGGVFFAGQRNDVAGDVMHYGKARVTLPPDHQAGQVERPSVFHFEIREDENRHVMIRKMEPLDAPNFFTGLDQSLASAADPSVMLFIHGYNVGFEDALRRTAQIAADLSFGGVPILYSWPSAGTITGYTADENTVDWSVPHLEELLLDVRRRTRARNLHVIVHSMGNRVLLGAAERLTLRYPAAQPMLDQVVMAAPDVDLANFESRYHAAITQAAKRVTVYASSGDRALQASMALHGYQRLGLSHDGMRTFMGLDTVDVSGLDTSLLGHSYYGSQHDLIRDIRALIELNEPPLRRKWLQAVAGPAQPTLWRFAGDNYIARQPQSAPSGL